jgi:hypothetical protein
MPQRRTDSTAESAVAEPSGRRTKGSVPSTARVAAIAAAGVAILAVCALAPDSRILPRPDYGDIHRYRGYAEQTYDGLVPYRDFVLEYPPGFLPVVVVPGPGDAGYDDRFRILMLALAAAAVVLVVVALMTVGASTREITGGVLLVATLPLALPADLVFQRYDVWPTALVLLALVALLHGRRAFGLGALGVGAAAKIYPIVLLPLVLLMRRGRGHLLRDLVAFAAPALVLVLPFAILAPYGVAHVARVLVERPLHVESLGASVLLAAHRLGAYEPTIYLSFGGSFDLAGPAAQVVAVATSLVTAAALVAVWVLFARGPQGPRDLLLAAATAVVGFVAFGKVFSPQYLIWVAAAVALVLGRVRPLALALTVGAALLTRYVYLGPYDDLLQAGRVSWLMLARNLMVVALFFVLVFELALRTRPEAQPANGP